MEQIHKLVTGCFVENKEEFVRDPDDEDDSEGEGDMQWQSYKDVADINQGKSFVKYDKPKCTKGDLINLDTGRSQKIRGNFPLPFVWWQMTILRTKTSKDKFLEPKDMYSLCYRLRDDPKRFKDKVVHLFLSRIQEKLDNLDSFVETRFKFEEYLKGSYKYNDLDLTNLEERLNSFYESFPEDEREGHPAQFKTFITESFDFIYVKLGQTHPELLHFLPQLFPFHFKMILSLKIDKLRLLTLALDEDPGILAFKPILARRCHILGVETSSDALIKSGLMSKVPQEVQDAMLIYEYLKKETKENGHTYVHYNKILDLLGQVVREFEKALDYLNTNKVTKTQMEGGYRIVFLMSLWKSEHNIAMSLTALWEMNEQQPWKLEVNWDSDDFQSIRDDPDQFRAAQLIANQPVVAISGKGGCGKTYVVTKVITAAKANRQRHTSNPTNTSTNDESGNSTLDHGNDTQDTTADVVNNEETQHPEEDEYSAMFDDASAWDGEEECPEKINLLLTAPTGKAANLLGKRAGCASYTLHQIIFSYRMLKPDAEWKHKDVNTLVVDECSLVSVSTFAFLIELLMEHAQLRRIVLLGDIRQLPSIEPGNFLEDTFKSLTKISCGIELTTNHRAESNDIISNATRISQKMYPMFNEERFMLRRLPEGNPGTTGDDYLSQDINVAVMKLLDHEALTDDVNSQFISFTRKVCESINDLCCKKYSKHRIKENGKYVFRRDDKICCTKNGYVNLYKESHGFMTCFEQPKLRSKAAEEDDSEGGVDRTIHTDCEIQDKGTFALIPDQKNPNITGSQENGGQENGQTGESEAPKPNQIRLCNGEIFFILDEVEKQDDTQRESKTFYQLSDKDPDKEFQFWVERRNMRKACKIRHAWARTIHTFQGSETDHVVYIVGRSKHQNWQHVYTAVTRGRKTVFIVGQESILRQAIKRSEIKRQTSLRKQLVEKFQKNKNFTLTQGNQTYANISTLAQTQANQTYANVSTYTCKPASTKLMTDVNQSINTRSLPSAQNTDQPLVNNTKDMSMYQNGPMRRVDSPEVIGDDTLNNTQFVTGILSSLASEHDLDIEEYDTDMSDDSPFTHIKPASSVEGNADIDMDADSDEESQSLLSGRTKRRVTEVIKSDQKHKSRIEKVKSNSRLSLNRNTGLARTRYVELEVMNHVVNDEDAGDDSEPDSDDSQSLLSPPSVSSYRNQGGKVVHTLQPVVPSHLQGTEAGKSTTQKQNGQSDSRSVAGTKEGSSSTVTDPNSNVDGGILSIDRNNASEMKKWTHLKNGPRHEKLNSLKGKSPVTRQQHGNISIQRGISPITPANLKGGKPLMGSYIRTGNSPLTPGFGNEFTPAGQNVQNTSSPVTNDSFSATGFHIRSGLSPLTPGYNESFMSHHSARHGNSPLDSSYVKDVSALSPQYPGAAQNSSRLNDVREIKEPKSNESQWSEVDESEYLNMDDTGMVLKSEENIVKAGQERALNSPKAGKTFYLNFTALRDMQSRVSPSLSKQMFNGSSCKTPLHANLSTNSQWSDIDDEQYMTLDLNDITNMADIGSHSNNGMQVIVAEGQAKVRPDKKSAQNYRTNQLIKTPEINVPDTPPSPKVPETPPRTRPSPGSKRQLSQSGEKTPPKRIYKQAETNSESPLRRSLAKLDFK